MGYIEMSGGGRLYRCDECGRTTKAPAPGLLPDDWREYWPKMLERAIYSCVCPDCELIVYDED